MDINNNQLNTFDSNGDFEMKSIEDKYHNLIKIIGKSGRYQKILITICLAVSFVGFYMFTTISLMKEMPDYKCIDSNIFKQNKEFKIYKKFQIVENVECIQRYCKNDNKFSSLIIVVDLESIINFISDFKIFCNVDEFFGSIAQSLFFGRLVGTIFFSYIGDKYGRRISYYIQIYFNLGSLMIMSITKNTLLISMATFFNGFSSQIFVLTIVILSEVIEQNWFGMYTGVVNSFFPFAGFVNVFLIYYTRNWNYSLYLYIIVLSIMVILSNRFIFESTSFLLKNKRYDELNSNIEFIAKINDTENIYKAEKRNLEKLKKYSLTELNEFQKDDKSNEKINRRSLKEVLIASSKDQENSVIYKILGPYYILFSSKENIFKMVMCGLLFFSVFFLFYGLLFNIDKIEGDLYMHNMMIFSSEFIADFNIGYILSRYKRIPTFIVINSISFILCLLLIYLQGPVPNIALFMLSYFISMSFVMMFCYTAEAFEPNIRNTASNLGMLIGSISVIVMPYILGLSSSNFLIFLIVIIVKLIIFTRLKETLII